MPKNKKRRARTEASVPTERQPEPTLGHIPNPAPELGLEPTGVPKSASSSTATPEPEPRDLPKSAPESGRETRQGKEDNEGPSTSPTELPQRNHVPDQNAHDTEHSRFPSQSHNYGIPEHQDIPPKATWKIPPAACRGLDLKNLGRAIAQYASYSSDSVLEPWGFCPAPYYQFLPQVETQNPNSKVYEVLCSYCLKVHPRPGQSTYKKEESHQPITSTETQVPARPPSPKRYLPGREDEKAVGALNKAIESCKTYLDYLVEQQTWAIQLVLVLRKSEKGIPDDEDIQRMLQVDPAELILGHILNKKDYGAATSAATAIETATAGIVAAETAATVVVAAATETAKTMAAAEVTVATVAAETATIMAISSAIADVDEAAGADAGAADDEAAGADAGAADDEAAGADAGAADDEAAGAAAGADAGAAEAAAAAAGADVVAAEAAAAATAVAAEAVATARIVAAETAITVAAAQALMKEAEVRIKALARAVAADDEVLFKRQTDPENPDITCCTVGIRIFWLSLEYMAPDYAVNYALYLTEECNYYTFEEIAEIFKKMVKSIIKERVYLKLFSNIQMADKEDETGMPPQSDQPDDHI